MKLLKILPLLLALTSCDPVGDAADQCSQIFDEKYEQVKADIWLQCTQYYETEVIPSIETQISSLVAQLEGIIEDIIDNAEEEFMTRIGCIRVSTTAGWDCSNTEICL